MSASTLATITTILAALSLLCIPAAYCFGRRSNVEHELDRRWSEASELPALNPHKAEDRSEPSDG